MSAYTIIIIADVLLAVMFAFQKKYQDKAGTSLKASLIYTILSGSFSAAIFFVINGFTVRVTLFSMVMAILFSAVITAYVLIGFRVMKEGNMSVYTLFLMSGGMTVPYIYGVLFLNEELTLLRTLGLFLIIGAIAVSNFRKGNVNRKQIFLCIAVFLLNGAASVISKAHQVSNPSQMVSSSDFVFLATISKVTLSILALLFCQKQKGKADKTDSKMVPLGSVILLILMAAIADGTSYLLQLMGAVNIPATVLYPLITGGTIVLSSLVDLVVFREKFTIRQTVGTGIVFLGTLMFL